MENPSAVNYTTLGICRALFLMPLKYRKGYPRLLAALTDDVKYVNVVQSVLRNNVCRRKRQLCVPCEDKHAGVFLLICVRILGL